MQQWAPGCPHSYWCPSPPTHSIPGTGLACTSAPPHQSVTQPMGDTPLHCTVGQSTVSSDHHSKSDTLKARCGSATTWPFLSLSISCLPSPTTPLKLRSYSFHNSWSHYDSSTQLSIGQTHLGVGTTNPNSIGNNILETNLPSQSSSCL